MRRKTVQSLFVIGCFAVAPLFAQTTTSTATTTTTTTSTKSTKAKSTRRSTGGSTSMKTRVYNDATRLGGLLRDAQTNVSVSADVWKTVANEANSLANRLYGHTAGNTKARGIAKDVRDRVRQFRDAALAGDASAARQHASEAAPLVSQLVDWSGPATTASKM